MSNAMGIFIYPNKIIKYSGKCDIASILVKLLSTVNIELQPSKNNPFISYCNGVFTLYMGL